MLVDDDAAAHGLDPDLVERELFQIRYAARGEQNVRHRARPAAEVRVDAVAVRGKPVDAAVQDHFDPLVLECGL